MVLKRYSLSPDVFYQLENACHYAGPLFFICLHITTLQTACKIYKDKSTGILSGTPFVGLFVTSFVWTLYAVMLPDSVLVYPSVFGIAAGFLCCVTFHVNATAESSHALHTSMYPAALVAVTTAIILANLRQVQGLGTAASVISVLALAFSHVSEFQAVIRDKSTASLNYGTSLLMWLNALAWATYGLIIRGDAHIFLPNLAGFVVATLQLHLFVAYGYSITGCLEGGSFKGKHHSEHY